MEKKPINIRLTLNPGTPLYEHFERVKSDLALTNATETVRALIKRHRVKKEE